jgi:hypothetical protein
VLSTGNVVQIIIASWSARGCPEVGVQVMLEGGDWCVGG